MSDPFCADDKARLKKVLCKGETCNLVEDVAVQMSFVTCTTFSIHLDDSTLGIMHIRWDQFDGCAGSFGLATPNIHLRM